MNAGLVELRPATLEEVFVGYSKGDSADASSGGSG
jgi:hypothetical protein